MSDLKSNNGVGAAAPDSAAVDWMPDLSAPLVGQVYAGGLNRAAYLNWVYKLPHHPRRGEPITPRLFAWPALEACTITPWWVVPILWLPVVAACWAVYVLSPESSLPNGAALLVFGILGWTAIEYVLHRFLYHGEWCLPDHRAALTAHFFLHGIHHKFPDDPLRLVAPPALAIAIGSGLWVGMRPLFRAAGLSPPAFTALFGAGMLGYIVYDLTHYALHHWQFPPRTYWRKLKNEHTVHHSAAGFEHGYGVTSELWDCVFGTRRLRGANKNAAKAKQG